MDIPKRLLVILLLYAFGRKVATTTNFMGLFGCAAGLWLFVVSERRRAGRPSKDIEPQDKALRTHHQIWKYWGITLLFLIFVLSLGGSNPQNTEFENIAKSPQDNRPLFDIFFGVPPNKEGHFSRNTFAGNDVRKPSDDVWSGLEKPKDSDNLKDMLLGDLSNKGGHLSRNALALDGTGRTLDEEKSIGGPSFLRNNFAPDGQQGRSEGEQKIIQKPEGQRDLYEMSHGDSSNEGGYFSRDTFAPGGQQRPTDEELQPVPDKVVGGLTPEIKTFLKSRIIDDKDNVNFLSEKLTESSEVIREAQRIHFNLFADILKKYKYAILFDVSNTENKGDSAISVGEAYFLRRMNLKLLFYATSSKTHMTNIRQARILADKYTKDEVVIFLHGGGNIIAYPMYDDIRFNVLSVFHDYQVMLFPQSIRLSKSPYSRPINATIKHYCCQENFTLVLRDQLSYDIAKNLYNGATRLLMAPDMAFQIGQVKRFMSPVFDILWLKRSDFESPHYSITNQVPKNLRVHVSDWLNFKTPKSDYVIESAGYVTTQGFFFLQRGRVVITDRLHGHILSTLLDIPHVLIDNEARKLFGYHNTWTKSVENTVYTDDPAQALPLAIALLEKYKDTLPPLFPYLDVQFNSFEPMVEDQFIRGYP